MITGDIILERYSRAEEYLSALRDLRDWMHEYTLFQQDELSLARTMALLVPKVYGETPGQLVSSIRNKRTFNKERDNQQCQSARFWGYACPFGANATVTADHVFPYALGGITEGPNLLWLCEVHNRIKGSDVHIFPWERGVPIWVPDVLSRIAPMVLRLTMLDPP